MRFIHIADVHLGMQPDAGFPWSEERGEAIWESFRRIIRLAGREKTDFLLIAGDLFQRQPLLRELKEINDLFASIPETIVVLIAGNHDYVKRESFYRGFDWADNVVMLLSPEPECVEVPEKRTAVYGCSYDKKEILENRLDGVRQEGKMKYHLLLAHGGDAGLYVGAHGGIAKGEVEDAAGAHDGHLRGADGQTNAAALEFAGHAACSLEAKGRSARKADGVDLIDGVFGTQQVGFARCWSTTANVNAAGGTLGRHDYGAAGASLLVRIVAKAKAIDIANIDGFEQCVHVFSYRFSAGPYARSGSVRYGKIVGAGG